MTAAPEHEPTITVAEIVELYDDAQRCALAAGLRYVSTDEPGLRRVRRGKGFSYIGSDGRPVTLDERARIAALAIPPAWKDVWICPVAEGHLLAIGTDDRGRRQYRYHDSWREFRDLLNFYRLMDVGPRLPRIRGEVARQLRRRTIDVDSVLAAMIRIVDSCGLRVGSEEYAAENDSYGLTTLSREHVRVGGGVVHFDFPGKSGKQAHVRLADRAVSRVVSRLLEHPEDRLFCVAGEPIKADDFNARLGELAGARITAKDFRTWHGTRVAFASLREHLPPDDTREQRVLNAIDQAAEFLNNTRAVARSHYVHPHVVEAYLDGSFEQVLATSRPSRAPGLDSDERTLLGFLASTLERHLHALQPAATAVAGER